MLKFQKYLYEQLSGFLHLNTSKLHPLGFQIDRRNSTFQIAFGEYELLTIFLEYLQKNSVMRDYEITIKNIGVIYKEHVIEIRMRPEKLQSIGNYVWEFGKFFDGAEGTEDGTIYHVDLTLENRLGTVKFFKNLFDESEELILRFE